MEAPKPKLLSELTSGERNLELKCKVLSVSKRDIRVKDQAKTIFSGSLADESATRPFTAWKDFNLHENEVIKIQNAYTTQWQDAIQINLGDNAIITKIEEELKGAELKVIEYKIKDLNQSLSTLAVIGKVLALQQREVVVKGVKKTCFNGVLGDETGKIQFTAWHDFGLKENDCIKIQNAWVKLRRGLAQLGFDSRASVEKLDLELEVKARELKIEELERQSAFDVILEGFILDIKLGSGLVVRCPQCKRVIQDICTIHGKVEGFFDLRIKAVLDDGSGVVNLLLGKELTERLLGKSLDECKKIAAETGSHEPIYEELVNIMLAKPLRVQGYSLKDDGVTFIGTKILELEKAVQAEANLLLEEVSQ